jgi:hypothetical protein
VPGELLSDRVSNRPPSFAIDPHDLLLRGVLTARENPRLDRRAVRSCANDVLTIDATMKRRQQPPSVGIGSDQADNPPTPAECGNVVRRIACAAADHFRRVVPENENGRLARHPRHFAVDEFVSDNVADDNDAPARKRVNERKQALFALSFAWQGMYGSGYQQRATV